MQATRGECKTAHTAGVEVAVGGRLHSHLGSQPQHDRFPHRQKDALFAGNRLINDMPRQLLDNPAHAQVGNIHDPCRSACQKAAMARLTSSLWKK